MKQLVVSYLAVSLCATAVLAQEIPAKVFAGLGGAADGENAIDEFEAHVQALLGIELGGVGGEAEGEAEVVIDEGAIDASLLLDVRVRTSVLGCEPEVFIPPLPFVGQIDPALDVSVTVLTDPPQAVGPLGGVVALSVGSFDALVRVSDARGNEVRLTFAIEVVDDEAPMFTRVANPTPPGFPREASAPNGTPIALQSTCRDGCDPNPQISYQPDVARYPVGDTAVRARCTDHSGNEARADITVRVVDTIAPRATEIAPLRVDCTSAAGAEVRLPRLVWQDDGTAADALARALTVDPHGVATHYPTVPERLQLAIGRHTLRYRATDRAGNQGRVDVHVEVVDTGGPRMRIITAPGPGWRSDDGVVNVGLTDGCSGDGADVELSVEPAPAEVHRHGDRVRLVYRDDGVYQLHLEATDRAGLTAQDDSIRFGIDRTAPRALVRTPDQTGVLADAADSLPIFPRAERLAIDFGGEDLGHADGVSGIATVRVVLDPDGAHRVLADSEYDGAGMPPRSAALRTGVGCALDEALIGGARVRDGLCTGDAELELRRLAPGAHVIEVTVTDRAGNETRTEAHFVIADLHAGAVHVLDRLSGLLPDLLRLHAPVVQPAMQALATVRDATERRIEDSVYDTPTFLGAGLEATRTAVSRLHAAAARLGPGLGDSVADLAHELARFARSDVALLADDLAERPDRIDWARHQRRERTTDLEFAADYLLAVDADLDQDAPQSAVTNTQHAYFHAKSALEGWVLDYDHVPNHAIPRDIARDYRLSAELLGSIAAEMELYASDGLPGSDALTGVGGDLRQVIRTLERLLEDGFDPDGSGWGLSDQQYENDLRLLRSVANRLRVGAQSGVWVRNYQWSMMMVVRYMTHASVEDAIFTRGQGRHTWPIYQRARGLIDAGIDLLAERRVREVIELYGQNDDSHCLLIAVYHCDFIDDEGLADRDRPVPMAEVPVACWDKMHAPRSWDRVEPVDGVPPWCQWGAQVEG